MSLQDVLHWLGQSCAVVGMLVQLSLGVSSGLIRLACIAGGGMKEPPAEAGRAAIPG